MISLASFTLAASLLAAAPEQATPETAVLDRFGNIGAVVYQGEQLDLRGQLRIPEHGWGRMHDPGQADHTRTTTDGDRTTFSGRMKIGSAGGLQYQQVIQQQRDGVVIQLQCKAESDLDVEGVYYWIEVPIENFSGGSVELKADDSVAAHVALPSEKPQRRHLLNQTGSQWLLADAANTVRVQCTLDRPCPVGVQDTREWNGSDYDIYIALHQGAMKQGDTTRLQMRLQVTGQPDSTPATLKLDASKVRYRLDGFGGNYCFNIESPITQYTLKNLRVAWARTEMTLQEWEPDNDNDSPADTNWQVLQQHDRAGSNLRREFELAAQIQQMGIPYCISIWHLPAWLYADPQSNARRPSPSHRAGQVA